MIDWTQILLAVIAAMIPVVSAVVMAIVNKNVKDAQAAATIGAAVKNSLGVMQQAAEGVAQHGGTSSGMTSAVQYVQQQAKPELARFPEISADDIAKKISAQIGLQNIASNIRAAAAPGATPNPMAAVTPSPQGRSA